MMVAAAAVAAAAAASYIDAAGRFAEAIARTI